MLLSVGVVIGNDSVSVSADTGFVGIGQPNAVSQLDVAGGVRALSGYPTADSLNVGFGFSSDETSGMVSLLPVSSHCPFLKFAVCHSFWTYLTLFNSWLAVNHECRSQLIPRNL